ncbi:integrase/recombinase XerD [Peribacillus deserti]|uniref:Integrase/recombinase XerD n=1 Tax=Peribacillus deserti TaxID=673318 RepID=A0ABS2QC59_9BACI|nr:tyrosine-type recombinase/integrase [Peribacillus deserti]MBM7690753.1 integrase/recombinase XerD [Peribacillus deserti]
MDNYWELTKQLPNKENHEMVNEFLLSLKLSKHSENTVLSYRRYLLNFFGEIEDTYSSLSSERILEWYQTNKGHLKESSFKQHLSVVSSFFNFCVKESQIERSPIKKRWFPRPPKAVPKYLDKGEIAKIRQESERTSLRDQALIEFMLTSGCRIGEVNSLNIENIDLENRTARVVGKGKKIRHVHFSDKCAILLGRYLESRQTKETSPIFVKFESETRLGISGIHRIMKKIGENAGLSGSLHAHRLRHTFATELLAKGAELAFISDELGHVDLSTTQIYARLPNHVIISQYRKFRG